MTVKSANELSCCLHRGGGGAYMHLISPLYVGDEIAPEHNLQEDVLAGYINIDKTI